MTPYDAGLWLLVVVPAAVGGALALAPRLDRVAAPVALVTAALTAALSVAVAFDRPEVAVPFVAGTDLVLAVDALAAVVLPAVTVVTVLVLLFAAADIADSRSRFHGLMLLFAAAACLTVVAGTLPTLLLAWEVMGATSYALIGFRWQEQHRVSAGLTAFLTTRTADLGLYLAAGAALAGGAGLVLADLPVLGPGWRDVAAAGVLAAGLGKAAQLPFSFWLSRAMAGPSPVSALLHSAAMVAMGGYLLLRTAPLLAATGWAGPVTAWAGALTALLLGAVAVAQRDLKQLLAASTAAQLGFVVMGAGVGTVSGGAAHLVAHAATKALLFLAAGAWLSALGTKHLHGLRGVAPRWPVVGGAATLGALALAGVAPLSLWATKDAVLAGAREESAALWATGLAASALSAAYAGKVLAVLWRRDGAGPSEAHLDEERPGSRHIGRWEQLPLVVLAAGAAVLGLLALPPVAGTMARAMGEPDVPEAGLAELLLSAAVALVVVVVVVAATFRLALPEPGPLRAWLGLERLAHAVAVRPTLQGAELLARFDDRVLDRAVDATGGWVLAVARRAADLDRLGVDAAVESVGAAFRRLGGLARRPQTGLLHQYYLQAVAVLAAALLLLVTVR